MKMSKRVRKTSASNNRFWIRKFLLGVGKRAVKNRRVMGANRVVIRATRVKAVREAARVTRNLRKIENSRILTSDENISVLCWTCICV